MAPKASPAVVVSDQLKSGAWTATRVLVFLVVLSRLWALLITLEVVPDFPDPVLKTISRVYASFDAVIADGLGKWGNVLLGNVVFGIATRICSVSLPRAPKGEVVKDGKKEEVKVVKKKGSGKAIREDNEDEGKGKIDISIGKKEGSMMKRNVFIWARVTQCVGFLVKNWEEGKKEETVVRAVDLVVTLGVVGLELGGVKWDAGVVEWIVKAVRGTKVEKKVVNVEKADGETEGVKLKLR